jgi:ubiquinone/menaquinone biosynthesis C-methylase UbiE
MKIEDIYNTIADTYNQKGSADVLLEANNRAFSYTTKHLKEVDSLLALGIGDGLSLVPYKEHFSTATIYGLDISENMLEKARERIGCEICHGSITDASSLVKKTDIDLILAHFVCAYVPIAALLQESKKLLSDKGILSLVTTTKMSFPEMQTILKKMKRSYNPLNKLIYYHVKRAMATVHVPDDLLQLQSELESFGFELMELKLVEIKIKLETEQDVFDFFMKGGWFASGLVHPLLSDRFLHKIVKRIIRSFVRLPYEDSMFVAFSITKKTGVND